MSQDVEIELPSGWLSRQQRRYETRMRAKKKLSDAKRKPQKHSLPVREKYTAQEIELARAVLMTGPKAQPPKWRAIRKTIRFLRANPLQYLIPRHWWGRWRSWPRNMGDAT